MIAGNSQRTTKVRVDGKYFSTFAKNNYDLDPGLGRIIKVEKGGILVGYSQTFEYIAGFITDVQLQKRTKQINGVPKAFHFIDIYIDSGGTNIILELTFTSGPGQSFVNAFRNLVPHLNTILCFKAWQFDPEKGQKYGRAGITIYPNTQVPSLQKGSGIKAYYVSSNYKNEPDENGYTRVEGQDFFRKPLFEKPAMGGGMEYDTQAGNIWMYNAFREDIYYIYNHYELAEQAPQTFGQAPVQNQQAYAAAPPPQANNFYANAPQTQQQYPHAAQHQQPQHYANTGYAPNPGPPTPPAPTQTYAAPNPPAPQQSFGPPPPNAPAPPNNMPPRPQRTEPVHQPPTPNNQPIHEVVAPQTPPPPAREYVQREPLPASPQQNTGNYNPNAGMATARTASPPPPVDEFTPFGENDDLPF